jgi:hypothetical protein
MAHMVIAVTLVVSALGIAKVPWGLENMRVTTWHDRWIGPLSEHFSLLDVTSQNEKHGPAPRRLPMLRLRGGASTAAGGSAAPLPWSAALHQTSFKLQPHEEVLSKTAVGVCEAIEAALSPVHVCSGNPGPVTPLSPAAISAIRTLRPLLDSFGCGFSASAIV